MFDFLGVPFYDDDLVKLGFRFLHNALFLALVVRLAWHPGAKDRQFLFSAMMLNITVFFICFAMKKLELGLGMALGLFAIFGVLRYRTETLRTKDLTYLFIVVGIAVINALSNRKTSYLELLAVNSLIVSCAIFGERLTAPFNMQADAAQPPKAKKQSLEYDRLELLAPERQDELLADLRARTYQPISQVRIDHIDLSNNKATLSFWLSEN
ncbi:MAG: DUF4956 domain-containing protein [Verrucomicrobiales bacterium]